MSTTLRSLLAVPALVTVLATAAAAPAAVGAAGPASGTSPSTLDWSACAAPELAGFECGTLTVALDRAAPTGATIDLAVARHRSAGKASQRIGSLIFNPGGPGGSGLESLPTIWRVLPAAAKARFDLVTWDPRGMGASVPLRDCATISMPLPATGTVDWPSVYADMRMDRAAANARCIAKNATLVAHMGTREVVNDLDALRAAVGDAKLTYWGMSYGTRIGYTYALTYPERIRAIVLDGTVDPSSSIVDLATSATARDQALGFFFELWPRAAEQHRRVRAALDERTVALPSGDVMTRWNFDALLDSAAGGESGYDVLAKVIAAADVATFGTGKAAADAKALLDQVHLRQAIDLAGPDFSLVNCIDYPDRPPPAQQDAISTSVRIRAPIAGWQQGFNIVSMCAGFTGPVDPVPTDFAPDWRTPLLIVGTTRDAATPYRWTANMALAFRASRVVTYVGAKHVVYGGGMSNCVNRHVSTYLIDLVRPANDVACPSAAKGPN
jgi:pimeloyl-ACP methyl ester carboxylesterase